MSDTISKPSEARERATSTGDLFWQETDVVQPSVWIGRYRGVMLGIIEHRDPEGFTATTHRGRGLGNFETLEEAQAAFHNN